jgi:hypothetical protein
MRLFLPRHLRGEFKPKHPLKIPKHLLPFKIGLFQMPLFVYHADPSHSELLKNKNVFELPTKS